jgi:large subunit ribosomal protein L4
MQIDVLNKSGQSAGQVELNADIFGIEPNQDAMHLSVVAYLAHQRQGTAKTKVRHEVSGGNKKPWKQKGRGTARSGSNRSPVWVGGGTIHGPKPHSYDLKVPKKINRLARKSALSLRASENNITVIEDFSFDAIKTKDMASVLKNLKLENTKTLVVLPSHNDVVYKSSRNIPGVDVSPASLVSTYDILSHKKLLIFKGALESIENTLIK